MNSIYQTTTLRFIRYDPSCVLHNLDNMSFFNCTGCSSRWCSHLYIF